MGSDNFNIKWIGYQENQNKVWGWFLDDAVIDERKGFWRYGTCFCFWAVCGKTISIKKRLYHRSELDRIICKKIDNGYKAINEIDLAGMWPSFRDDLHRKMIFETLSMDSWGMQQ